MLSNHRKNAYQGLLINISQSLVLHMHIFSLEMVSLISVAATMLCLVIILMVKVCVLSGWQGLNNP